MWKYNRCWNNELYHSDTYLGEDFSDGVYHWKYLDKIKLPKGKWRYIYERAKGIPKAASKSIDNARKSIDKALGSNEKKRYKDASAKYKSAKKAKESAKDYNNKISSNTSIPSSVKKIVSDNYKKKVKEFDNSKTELSKKKDSYSKTAYGKLDKAKNFVKKALKNLITTKTTAKPTVKPAASKQSQDDEQKKIDTAKYSTVKEFKTAIKSTIKTINPNYDDNDKKWNSNCAYCAMTYDMRRRGEDVTANPHDSNYNITKDTIELYYKDSKVQQMGDYVKRQLGPDSKYTVDNVSKALTKELTSQGNGARGILLVYWSGGGGHAINYEIVENKIIIIDAQDSNRSLDKSIKDYVGRANNVSYMRTDNVEPTNQLRLRACSKRKRGGKND